MKNVTFAIACAAMVVGTPVVAADMPLKAPIKRVVATSTWSGFYAGLNAGAMWTNVNYGLTQTGDWQNPAIEAAFPGTFAAAALANGAGTGSFGQTKFVGGGQVGFNYQVGTWVFGLEADLNYSANSSTSATRDVPYVIAAIGCAAAVGCTQTVNTSHKIDSFMTLRPRIGYAFNNLLIYGTGGLASAHVRAAQSVAFNAPGFPAFQTEAGESGYWQSGWAYGGGVEWMFNQNWTMKLEYIHVQFNSRTFDLFNPLNPTFTGSNTTKLQFDVVRLGLNYKF